MLACLPVCLQLGSPTLQGHHVQLLQYAAQVGARSLLASVELCQTSTAGRLVIQ